MLHLLLLNCVATEKLDQCQSSDFESCFERNWYIDDVLLASDELDFEKFASEGCKVFGSRGFNMRKRVANAYAKTVSYNISPNDLSPGAWWPISATNLSTSNIIHFTKKIKLKMKSIAIFFLNLAQGLEIKSGLTS